jgi:capsular exopolysaccharide synthesis family protein
MSETVNRVADADAPMATPGLLAPAEADLNLGEFIRIIDRRKWVLIGIVAAALILALIVTRIVTPLYKAEALVLIDPQTTKIVSLESVVAGLSADQETVQSEALVLASRSLAERVIRRLGLAKEAEFNPALGGGIFGPGNKLATPAQQNSAVIDRFLKRLDVRVREASRVISVSFSAEQPQRAAAVANALTDEYILARLETKFDSTKRATGWLNSRVAELREKVATAESNVETVRRKYGLVGGSSGTLSSQELSELNSKLITARAERSEAEARLRRMQDLVRSPQGAATASEVLDSPLIQRLREQEAEVQRRVAELSSELGERHPKMVQLRAEAADIKAKIDTEVAKILDGLENQASVARAREGSLQRSLNAIQDRVATGNQKEIELRAAEREAEANRSLLATLLARQKETMSQEDLGSQQADARVVAAADPPVEPSFPNVPVILGLTFLASTILGLLAILVIELLDGGFRSGEQLEQATGVASLGFIPIVPAAVPDGTILDYLRKQPKSAFGEALRTLNWSISLASPDQQPPRTVLVTSSYPGEGKTSVATCLAWVQSLAGQRVLLIDAETRRPSVHELMRMPREPGLLDVLSGRASLEEALRRQDDSKLAVLTAGSPTPNVPSLLGSRRMEALIAECAGQFDLIVIDSPPVMVAADARILAQRADATLMVVRWARTRREPVLLSLRQLNLAGARLAGVLLNRVDVRKHARYSYGDSGAYTGTLEKYYTG